MTGTPLNALLRPRCRIRARKHRIALSKPEVLATSSHGRVKASTEVFVTFILGEIKLWKQQLVKCSYIRIGWQNSRLKQVCELGRRSLLP